MGLRRRMARSIAAAAVGVGASVAMAAGPAGASHETELFRQSAVFSRTYTNLQGERITCRITGSSELLRYDPSSAFGALASTTVTQPLDAFPEDPCLAVVAVEIEDVSGYRASRVGYSAVTLQDETLAIVATHRVVFTNCASDCTVTFTTRPK